MAGLRLFRGAAALHGGSFRQHRSASVAILFATAVIPLMMCIGLAIDYSFYVADEAQLNSAADSAALHAVRAASQAQTYGMTYQAAGLASAQQWFAAAVTPLINVSITGGYEPLPASNINITYDATSGSFTATVSYKGLVYTNFSKLFHIGTWNIGGTATSTISNSFVEVQMLIDNSSSMLIGASDGDIKALEYLTECAPTVTATAASQSMGNYSWNFPAGYGYGLNSNGTPNIVPNSTMASKGSCFSQFSGPTGECFYPVSPTLTNIQSNGYCPAGTGVPSVSFGGNLLPQAPCAFACHTNDGIHDYYTLARAATNPKITLRFDVVQAAAAQVIQTMINLQQVQNQFSVGVYQFNNLVTQVHPAAGTLIEADSNLQQALTDVKSITTPVVIDDANTNFQAAMAYLTANFKPGGTGGTVTTPRKNLFIVTDGMDDYRPGGVPLTGSRVYGAMTNPSNETNCAPLKAMGFTIYVLYTPYTPLANNFYLTTPGVIGAIEPATPDPPAVLALKACASSTNGVPNYYQASSAADINTALQTMLQQALNSPGRITN